MVAIEKLAFGTQLLADKTWDFKQGIYASKIFSLSTDPVGSELPTTVTFRTRQGEPPT